MNFIDQIFAILGILALLIVCLIAWAMAKGSASITLSDKKGKELKKWGSNKDQP